MIRRITDKTFKQFVADEIAGPLGADYQIGALREGLGPDRAGRPTAADGHRLRGAGPAVAAVRRFTGPVASAEAANSPEWRRADMGALNGHTNAKGLLTVMRTLTLGGSGPLKLSPSTVDLVFQEQANGIDLVLMTPLRFGIGYGLTPTETVPYLPAGQGRVLGRLGRIDHRDGPRPPADHQLPDEPDGARASSARPAARPTSRAVYDALS